MGSDDRESTGDGHRHVRSWPRFRRVTADSKGELETYRQALVQVIEEAKRLHALGLNAEEAIEQAQFGDLETWSLRSSQGSTAIQRVFLELNGELPGSGQEN